MATRAHVWPATRDGPKGPVPGLWVRSGLIRWGCAKLKAKGPPWGLPRGSGGRGHTPTECGPRPAASDDRCLPPAASSTWPTVTGTQGLGPHFMPPKYPHVGKTGVAGQHCRLLRNEPLAFVWNPVITPRNTLPARARVSTVCGGSLGSLRHASKGHQDYRFLLVVWSVGQFPIHIKDHRDGLCLLVCLLLLAA